MTAHPPQLRHPIVLVHGLGALSRYGPFEYFHGIPELLRASGNRVLVPSLTAWQTIEVRAAQLRDQIEKELPEGTRVNLIGHSMGGLDARYLAARLDPRRRVASVTTVGTPNHGTLLADLGLQALPGTAFTALEATFGKLGSSARGIEQVSTRYHHEVFSREAPDAPEVGYFSATSVIRGPLRASALPQFWGSHPLLKLLEGDNDGFVSETSSRYGEHICTHFGDHYAQIGQILGRTRGMDHLRFFSEIVSRLRERGF
jgi:triacylglycerol lipase